MVRIYAGFYYNSNLGMKCNSLVFFLTLELENTSMFFGACIERLIWIF